MFSGEPNSAATSVSEAAELQLFLQAPFLPGLLGSEDSGSVLGRNAVLTYLPRRDEVVSHMRSAAALPVLMGEEPEKGPPTLEPEIGSSSNESSASKGN